MQNIADTITLAAVAGGKSFAFVGHDTGFITFDVSNLTQPSPSMSMVEHVCNFPGCQANSGVLGFARAGDRLLLWIYELGPGGRMRVVEWDETTGLLTGAFKDFPPGSVSFPPYPDPWPRAYRSRFRDLPGATPSGDYFVCSEPYVIQYRWTKGATIALDSLTFKGHWQSAYRKQIQDCLLFNFPSLGNDPKLLVVKNSEAFAIVEPHQ